MSYFLIQFKIANFFITMNHTMAKSELDTHRTVVFGLHSYSSNLSPNLFSFPGFLFIPICLSVYFIFETVSNFKSLLEVSADY